MAIIAPTYVLKESQSSKQLWKNIAGTHPPQPVHERAFYKKVWTQNFSFSQVDYQIPTKVIIATSPISVPPFDNENFCDAGQSLSGLDDFMADNDDSGVEQGLASEIVAVSTIKSGNKTTTLSGRVYGSSSWSKNQKEALMGPHNHYHTLLDDSLMKIWDILF